VEKKKNAIFFGLLQLAGQLFVNLIPNDMYKLVKPFILDTIQLETFDFNKYFAQNIHPIAKPTFSHNTTLNNWFAITCTQILAFEYTLGIHNNRTVHNDYYVAFDFNKIKYQMKTKQPKFVDGLMKIFITSEHSSEQFNHRTSRNFLYIVDTVPFKNSIKWFNEIHYQPNQMKFEFHDKLKKDRRDVCINAPDRQQCEQEIVQEKGFQISEQDELDEAFMDSLVFKVFLYFNLKDENKNDLAHLFFEINEYKTGKKFHNQDFFSHVD